MSEADAISVRLADGSDSEAIAGLVTTLAAELKEHSPITPAYEPVAQISAGRS